MTVQDLLALLEDLNPDLEVRLAYQPNYPLWSNLAGISVLGGDDRAYLVADPSGESGYADSALWSEMVSV